MNDELLEKVMDQILSDVVDRDHSAIHELLSQVPVVYLLGFLKETE